MTREVIVISGPERSGKLPLAQKLLAEDKQRALVHRDHLRSHVGTKLDEWEITILMEAQAKCLLMLGYVPVICAWNLEPADRKLWTRMASDYAAKLNWLDVRKPEVAAMIPPLELDGGDDREWLT